MTNDYGQLLLGAVLHRNELIPAIQLVVSPEMVPEPSRRLYAKAVDKYASDGYADLTVFRDDPKDVLAASEAMEACITPSAGIEYARIIRDRYRRVRVATSMKAALETVARKGDIDAAIASVYAASAGYDDEPRPESIIADVREMRERRRQVYLSGRATSGIPTGIPKLDAVTDGIGEGHLWVVGAYTSSGKSFLALNVAVSAARAGHGVTFINLEMTMATTAARASAIMSGVPIDKLFPTDEEAARRDAADDELSKLPIRFSSVPNIAAAVGEIRRAEQEGRSLIVIDYLQLFRPTGRQTEYELYKEAAQTFQSRLKDSKVSMLLLSQVSNESVRNPAETIDFKGSGDIAASADVAVMLRNVHSQEERYERSANGEPLMVRLDVRKNRHGRTGIIPLAFTPENGRMAEVPKDSPEMVHFTK